MKRILGCAGRVLVGLACSGFAYSQPTEIAQLPLRMLKVYKTQRHAEKQVVLPLPAILQTAKGKQFQEHYKVLFSLAVNELSEHDVLHVAAEMEATNDCGYEIALGTWLVIGNSPQSTVPEPAKGEFYLSYPSGFNITPGMHHGFATRSSVFVVPQGMKGTRHINFVAYAQTDRFDCKRGNGLQVEQGYGQLNVLHFLGK